MCPPSPAHPTPPPSLAPLLVLALQLVLEQLYPGDPIMAVREPSNPYDPHAVMLTNMAGQQLGYVPRERAPDIQQEVSWLVHVHST